jgi:hypothetical protein
VLPEDQIPHNTLFIRTIDTEEEEEEEEEEAGASMYRGSLIYGEPFLAWRHTNLVCGYDSSIRQSRHSLRP